ncbi:MAG: hypothetical protein EBV03_10095 [Proteobacteria bacterium]|nr:hypothetical protein [Pseudomonadota bacterium]
MAQRIPRTTVPSCICYPHFPACAHRGKLGVWRRLRVVALSHNVTAIAPQIRRLHKKKQALTLRSSAQLRQKAAKSESETQQSCIRACPNRCESDAIVAAKRLFRPQG